MRYDLNPLATYCIVWSALPKNLAKFFNVLMIQFIDYFFFCILFINRNGDSELREKVCRCVGSLNCAENLSWRNIKYSVRTNFNSYAKPST